MNEQVGSLVQDQTRDDDSNATPGSEIVHMEDGSGKECNHQCTWHKDKDFKAQTRNYSHQNASGDQTHNSYIYARFQRQCGPLFPIKQDGR